MADNPAGLFWRAVFAFLVLPGTFAFLIPFVLVRPDLNGYAFNVIGLVPLIIGFVLLLWCVRDFYVKGKGTLAPWSPPRHLVVVGLYRFSRNPMYVAVVLISCGWALGFHSQTLWIYTIIVIAAFHLRVVFAEEPWLTRTHGEAYLRYRARVRRWF